jgi:hypothetical protein
MKKFIVLFLLICPVFGVEISKRFVGLLKDYKTLNSEIIWVQTSTGREYQIEYQSNLFIGDSVFEYWVNYSKRYFGTESNSKLIKIIETNH